MKIYTKMGDSGETGLLGGVRVPKNDPRIEALGSVDVLNAWLGVCAEGAVIPEKLRREQNHLFDLGAELAHPRKVAEDTFDAEILILETEIDAWEADLEPLRNFILPGGCSASANLHYARALCRTAERRLLDLGQGVYWPTHVRYLNRLSDWMFVAARWSGYKQGVEDVLWTKR